MFSYLRYPSKEPVIASISFKMFAFFLWVVANQLFPLPQTKKVNSRVHVQPIFLRDISTSRKHLENDFQ